jgi:hypothetical protein
MAEDSAGALEPAGAKIRVFASTLAKAFAEAVEWPQQMTE